MVLLPSVLKVNTVDKVKQPKLYVSISSEGYGHSSRAIALARGFDAHEIVVATYGYALDKIRSSGIHSLTLPQELKLVGSDGSFDVGKTIIRNHSWALTFNQIIQTEIDLIRQNDATCVIADGRLAPVMAADKLGLPCIVITNQSAFYPFFEKDSALVKIFGKSFEWVMKTWLSSAEEILIPDFPPPYTVCLPNLSKNLKVMKRQRFVGPLVSWKNSEIVPIQRESNKPYVVITLGGHSYRKPLLDAVIGAARILKNIEFDIFTSFKVDNPPPNVNIQGFIHNIAPHMKAASLIITQAGHSTAMELLTLGKPALIVPDRKQIEQENNALRLCELGVATQMYYDEFNIRTMAQRIEMMLESSCYLEAAQDMAKLAEEIDGTKEAEKVLRDYFNRIQAY